MNHRLKCFALGLYRYRPLLAQQILTFTSLGGYILDLAPNYANGSAFDATREALSSFIADTKVLRVNSKCGFFQSSASLRECVAKGIVTSADIHLNHALTPKYIRWQLAETLSQIGLSSLDTLFLHNPEVQQQRHPATFWPTMSRCVHALEELCAERQVRAWGISSWAGFDTGPCQTSAFTVYEWQRCAEDVAGSNNHFAAVQFPVSLARSRLAAASLFEKAGALYEAQRMGLEVFASSCLHGGELPKVISREFIDVIDGAETAAQACVLYSISVPGVSVALLSPNDRLQLEDLIRVATLPRLPLSTVCEITELLVV